VDAVDALQRRAEPPMAGPLCDLLWADPADDRGCLDRELALLPAADLHGILGDRPLANPVRGCRWVAGVVGERATACVRVLLRARARSSGSA
jgi:diadenosine tetraphosphatase ApaH/serine/threonine PP2A family protein phosphatase